MQLQISEVVGKLAFEARVRSFEPSAADETQAYWWIRRVSAAVLGDGRPDSRSEWSFPTASSAPILRAVLVALLWTLLATPGASADTLLSIPFGGPIGSVQPTEIAVWPEPAGVAGWSFGVCYDESRLAVHEIEYARFGPPPVFFSNSVVPGGWTSNAILSSTDSYTFEPLVRASYEILGPAGVTEICTCDTLGVPLEITAPWGAIVPLDAGCTDFTIQEETLVELDLVDVEVDYSIDSPVRQFSVDATLAQPDGSWPDPQGLSFGVTHDPTLLALTDAYVVGQLTTPSIQWLHVGIHPAGGWTIECVFDFFDPLPFGPEPEGIVRAVYTTIEDEFDGSEIATELRFTQTIGWPRVTTVVIVGSASVSPLVSDGQVTFLPFDGDLFRRGDCNDDGNVDIADGVTILSELFAASAPAGCPAACDVNADAIYDIADAIYAFSSILLGGPPPPSPFEECGGADTSFPCPSFNSCD